MSTSTFTSPLMAQNSMPSWCVKARSWDVARPDSDDCDFLFFLLSHGLSCLNPFFYCLKYPFFEKWIRPSSHRTKLHHTSIHAKRNEQDKWPIGGVWRALEKRRRGCSAGEEDIHAVMRLKQTERVFCVSNTAVSFGFSFSFFFLFCLRPPEQSLGYLYRCLLLLFSSLFPSLFCSVL